MSEIEDRNGVQSVEVAGGILAVLAAAGMALALKDIARLGGLSPGKVHRYLVSLCRCGLVHQEADTARYGVGPAAIALGLSGLRSINVVRCASDALPDIRDALNETAVLAIWSEAGPVIVHLEESSRQIYMNVRVGSILPLLRSAVGRVFAAYLGHERVAELLETDPEDVLAETRRCGIGMVKGDLVPGVSALAAPILDHRGEIVACVGVLGRSEELDADPDGFAAGKLKELALSISQKIGYDPHSMPRHAANE